ncbi:fimbria/pilus outer membrane usher protein [Desulfotignum phosphitoxidans]|uniref:P pilus assembly porin PapC n=1 Tax=Desulfotignum phosphitoxidans DSM 13687 TaxID=1286635 RepID=S0G882_9BACT|nr:fimbria/pilus outer membrane usher protein [Desulfotignum phosphitoxidans]EMS81581.1 P pilus assembly porin PapC [Desulfotignum phosphitoxidans DSM 13687]
MQKFVLSILPETAGAGRRFSPSRTDVLKSLLHVGMITWMLGGTVMANGISGFYAVVVNGVPEPGFVFVVFDEKTRPYMALKDFTALGFASDVPAVTRDGMKVVPLFGRNGLKATVDPERFVITLDILPGWYTGTRINLNAPHPGTPMPAPPGALLNYGLQVNDTDPGILTMGSNQSLALFGAQGMFQITTAATSIGRPDQKFSRLGTTYLRDNEEKLTTLLVGDGVMQPRVGVPGVRYGGISWQSNFDLDPTFSTLETPTIFDEARLPSTLEFFLNDRRVGTPLSVAPGPFEISGLPTVDTSGQVKVVIRDALNNERIVTIPYIHTERLFRQGLHSFSYTAGLLRPELDDYQTPFLASAHRWGLTRRLTLGLGGTVSADNESLGAKATFLLPGNSIGETSLAQSISEAGSGYQVGASVHWGAEVSSAGASISYASDDFRLLGDTVESPGRPRNDLRVFAARSLENLGSVSASWGRLSTWDNRTRTILGAGWAKSFRNFSVSLNGLRSDDDTTVLLTLNVPLGSRGFVSTSLQQQKDAVTMRAEYTSPPVTDKGMAYRLGLSSDLSSNDDNQSSYFAGVDARSALGEHGLDIEVRPDREAWRMRTSGSLGVLAGRTFFAPPINSGFALVTTGDAPGIPLYRWNLPVAVSDSRGQALITTLSPYQENLLAVRPEEVPLEYRITRTEITAVPRGRGGVLVEFPMLRERPALLILHLPDGRPVPAGARVKVLMSGETALVGLRGEAYLTDLPEEAELEVTHQGSFCHIIVKRPDTTDPQPRLGPYTCDLEGMK